MQAAPPQFGGPFPPVIPPAPQPQQPYLQAPIPVPLPHPSPNNYLETYARPEADSFNGNYTNLYNEFSVGNTTPQDLRNALYRDGNTGTFLHLLVHVRPANAAPADPGMIVVYHRLTRHDARFGQVPTVFDNMGVAFFGDVHNGQAPISVTIPDAHFNQSTVVQTPTDGLLAQLIAADPDAEVFGPYAAGDADTLPTIIRPVIVVPNRYALPFLTQGMVPKAAYQALGGMIAQDGNTVACAPLLDWLRVTLTRRAPNQPPRTCVDPLASPTFATPQAQQTFMAYRLGIVHNDFPHLQPGSYHGSAVLISQGINALTAEQRLARQEAEQRRNVKDAPKSPADYFSVLLDRLMRWCHATREADLPPIYEQIANTKKGQLRSLLQTTVEDALDTLGYVEDFPVSSTLATKILELKWHSKLPDNFTVGIHLFSLGSLDDEVIEAQRRLNNQADAVTNGAAAPSLLDLAAIQDGKHDLCLPRTFAQLRYLVERSEALWSVLLGSQHPVTYQHHLYRTMLVSNEKRLERVKTNNPSHQALVPALMGRAIQLELNHWLGLQTKTPAAVPFDRLIDIFANMERGQPWEPPFPQDYLQQPTSTRLDPSALLPAEISLSSTSTTMDDSTLSRSTGPSLPAAASGAGHPPPTNKSTTARNMAYKTNIFGQFKAMNLKAAPIKEHLTKRGVYTPLNARGARMCLTYHVVGVCNERCRYASDHVPHSDAEDAELAQWANLHYKPVPKPAAAPNASPSPSE
jgi:hypothetical protein